MLLDQRANHIQVAQRDGGEDVVAGASLNEQRDDIRRVVPRLRKERRPADHGDVLVIACIVGVRARIEQHAGHLYVVRCGRDVQRGRVMPRLTRSQYRGILAQECADGVGIAAPDGLEPARREVAATAIDFGF